MLQDGHTKPMHYKECLFTC